MIRQNIPLGRIMGIPIGLDCSWFLIFRTALQQMDRHAEWPTSLAC